MKKIKGSRTAVPNRPVRISTDLPCIHGSRCCDSGCPFFDDEETHGGSKVVLTCSGAPVAIFIEHESTNPSPIPRFGRNEKDSHDETDND